MTLEYLDSPSKLVAFVEAQVDIDYQVVLLPFVLWIAKERGIKAELLRKNENSGYIVILFTSQGEEPANLDIWISRSAVDWSSLFNLIDSYIKIFEPQPYLDTDNWKSWVDPFRNEPFDHLF